MKTVVISGRCSYSSLTILLPVATLSDSRLLAVTFANSLDPYRANRSWPGSKLFYTLVARFPGILFKFYLKSNCRRQMHDELRSKQ